jgi:hypothetical protein
MSSSFRSPHRRFCPSKVRCLGSCRYPVDFAPVSIEALDKIRHLVKADGFNKVRVGPELIGAVHVGLQIGGGKDYDQQALKLWFGPNPLEDLKSVGTWHAKVEENEERHRKALPIGVGALAPQISNRLLSVANGLQGVAQSSFIEGALEKYHVIFVIFDEEDVSVV